MLVSATITFEEVVLFIHIAAVVIAFGLVIGYPFIALAAERLDHRALPALHRSRTQLGRLIVNPGLALVLISGIYLASEDHDWKYFFTQWGLGMVVVLGGLEGAVVMRGESKLAELAEAEVAVSGPTGVLSDEYTRTRTRTDMASRLMAVLVIVTLFFMASQLS
jgi:hypothetical protein